jgi:hypothetical protein
MVMLEQTSVESLQKRIDAQGRRIEFLETTNQRLQTENDTLKAALTGQTIEAERSYKDNLKKFDALFIQIWPIIADINKIWGRPALYDEITKAFQIKHPGVAKGETISRKVREMVAEGWLATPRRGEFIVVKKPNP